MTKPCLAFILGWLSIFAVGLAQPLNEDTTKRIFIDVETDGFVRIARDGVLLLDVSSWDVLSKVDVLKGFSGGGLQRAEARIIFSKGTRVKNSPGAWPDGLTEILDFCRRHGVPAASATFATAGLNPANLLSPESMEEARQRRIRFSGEMERLEKKFLMMATGSPRLTCVPTAAALGDRSVPTPIWAESGVRHLDPEYTLYGDPYSVSVSA